MSRKKSARGRGRNTTESGRTAGAPARPSDERAQARAWPRWLLPIAIGVAMLAALAGAYVWSITGSIRRDPKLSILLISIDTLRADALGAYGNTRVETPWIDRLAREGVRFETAHAHNVVTFPSHANMLSGLLPLVHGVRDNTGFRFPADEATLATRLKERGFRTGAFVSAFVLDSRFGLQRGFDVYDDRTTGVEKQTPFVVPDRKGTETVAAALEWIRAQGDEQFFALVHLYDPHFPYKPDPALAARYRDAPYLGEVASVDRALAPLLELVLDGPLRARTLVVFTSDHGESLDEHGESTHGTFAYEATLRVPLVLHAPTLDPRVVKTPAQHIDLVPTVLDALGIEPAPELPGRSLLPLAAGARASARRLYFEALSSSLNQGWAPLYGIFDGRYKYIDLPLPELYDLSRDAKEATNLVAREPELLERLKAALARERASDRGAKRGEEDAATLERLRALGYVAAAAPAASKERYTAEDDPKNLIDIDRRNREVVTLFMSGKTRLNDAIAKVSENLAQRPNMAGANLQLAYLERLRGNLPAAVAAARRAVDLKPLDAEAVALLGAYLTESGRPDEALKFLEPYAKVGAVDYDLLTALGLARSALGRLDAAREAFVRARDLDPSNGLAWANLGTIELMAGRRVEAQAALGKAIEVDPGVAKAHNTLGVMAAQEGRAEAAIEHWRRAIEANPADYQTLFNLGTTLDRVGRRDEARSYYEAYLEHAPIALEARDIERVKARLVEAGRQRH